MMKPRLASVILSGCTGCHLALLDAHEGFAELLGEVDLVFSPFSGPDEMPEADVVLVEGAVATEHDETVVRRARERAGTLVAMGSCATLGGIGGLRNLECLEDVLAQSYGAEPPGDGLPRLLERVRPVSDVVPVDVEVPGCAPPTETLVSAIRAAAAGDPFELPRRNLCDECPREHVTMLEHSRDFVSEGVVAVMELDEIDPGRCLLEQGVVCMGQVTRQGCGARCTKANMPCRGCAGPSRREFEQGAKMVDALASLLPAGAIMFMDDLIGTGYRFSLPVSVFPTPHGRSGTDDE